jgi:RNA polymerase sigma-70 factor (ECF subfamily)
MSNARQIDIAVLTGRMSKGDEAAYRVFYELYFPRLFRYLLVVTSGREEEAREALQLTLLRVVRHVRQFDSEQTFWSWLTVLARSAVVDEKRKRHRYLAFLDGFFQKARSDAEADPASDERLRELLAEQLAALPFDERELIEQKYSARKSVKEIASDSGASEKSVESALGRVRRKLKERLLTEIKHEL